VPAVKRSHCALKRPMKNLLPLFSKLKWTRCTPISREALRALKELQERAYALGFPAASMDSLKTDSSVVEVSFSRNASLRIHQLTNGNLPEAWLAETGFRPGEWSGRPVGPRFVEKLSKNILDYAENNGFPFAMFRMDSLSLFRARIKWCSIPRQRSHVCFRYHRSKRFSKNEQVVSGQLP
jgi:hypothetical protein